MSWLRIHAALLSSVVLASSAAFVRADCGCAAPAAPACTGCGASAAPACGGCAAPCAPAMRTVTVTEWVPEQYQATRTVYKQECVQERYTAYRTECVAETHNEQVTVMKSVAETHNESRCVYTSVPTVEERTVMKQVVTCVPETTCTTKCEDHGHYECREVPCGPTFGERLHKLCHRNDCCECTCEAPRTRTERVWVACKVEVQVPCTHMVRHVECVPTVEHFTTFKCVPQTVTVPVTTFRCVPEVVTHTCTVMVPHQVAYEAVRTVSHCVPVQETYTACRMASHTVEKQVACEAPSACGACGASSTCGECESGHHGFHLGGRMGGLFHREKGCGCESSCSTCGSSGDCGCH